MSKIIVDEMPTSPWDCPFVSGDSCWKEHRHMMCCSLQRYICSLEEGGKCELLTAMHSDKKGGE